MVEDGGRHRSWREGGWSEVDGERAGKRVGSSNAAEIEYRVAAGLLDNRCDAGEDRSRVDDERRQKEPFRGADAEKGDLVRRRPSRAVDEIDAVRRARQIHDLRPAARADQNRPNPEATNLADPKNLAPDGQRRKGRLDAPRL